MIHYPKLPVDPIVEQIHGVDVADPYRYLEDRGDSRTAQWLAAEATLCDQVLAALPGRDTFRAGVAELMGAGAIGTPRIRGERRFFARRDPGRDHPVVYVADASGERALVDPSALDPTGLTTLDAWSPDLDGARLAYQISHGGDEESVLFVLDVETGGLLDGPIDRLRYSPVAWCPGGEELFYVRRLAPELLPPDERQFHRRVYRHRVGADPAADKEIFGAGRDMTAYYDLALSHDGRWLTVTSSLGTAPRDDVWIADLQAAPERPTLVEVAIGVDARFAGGVGFDGRLYLFTTLDAPRGRILVADPARPTEWSELVAEDPERVLEGFLPLDLAEPEPAVALLRTRKAIAQLSLLRGGVESRIELPGTGTITALTGIPGGGRQAWIGYSDFTTPGEIYRLEAATGELNREAVAPGSPPVPAVEVSTVEYRSDDGTPIQLYLLAPTGAARPAPTILNGYGGFGVPMAPGFSPMALEWVRHGGIYAIACLRGGGEQGEAWRRAGNRENKQRVFDDFAAAARYLVDSGVTTREQLGIWGGSNGGLLIGAALTQHPELYAAAVCSAPLLDMVRYEKFGLGATWNDEYGRADDPVEFGWLYSYSPYHQVTAGTAYPPTLFTVFDSDTRVDPLHARKMCAAMQAATSGDGPIVLRAEANSGHGASSVTKTAAVVGDRLAFLANFVAAN